jgi:hypothetical protein
MDRPPFKKRPVVIPCRHLRPEPGPCFDYCPDCGAVRSAPRPGLPPGPWHSCELCQFPS